MRSLPVLSGLLCGAGLVAPARAQALIPAQLPAQPTPQAVAPATDAAANRSYTIAVVANPERAALVARLKAELADLGFRVEEAPPDLGSDALDALTDGAHFLALVRVDEAGQAIEFRIRAPDSGELIRDRVPLRPRRADVAAVATVELLRARLIKLGILAAPPPPLMRTMCRSAPNARSCSRATLLRRTSQL